MSYAILTLLVLCVQYRPLASLLCMHSLNFNHEPPTPQAVFVRQLNLATLCAQELLGDD